jgi:hypothetical protein
VNCAENQKQRAVPGTEANEGPVFQADPRQVPSGGQTRKACVALDPNQKSKTGKQSQEQVGKNEKESGRCAEHFIQVYLATSALQIEKGVRAICHSLPFDESEPLTGYQPAADVRATDGLEPDDWVTRGGSVEGEQPASRGDSEPMDDSEASRGDSEDSRGDSEPMDDSEDSRGDSEPTDDSEAPKDGSEVADARPAVADARPEAADARPEAADARPVVADARPVVVDARPVVAGA